jgi:hypothetical protein
MDTKMAFVITAQTPGTTHNYKPVNSALRNAVRQLYRGILYLKKCHKISQYTHERHYAHAKSTAFHQLIFMKLTTTESAYVEIIHTKFNQNLSRNVDSMRTKFIYASQ